GHDRVRPVGERRGGEHDAAGPGIQGPLDVREAGDPTARLDRYADAGDLGDHLEVAELAIQRQVHVHHVDPPGAGGREGSCGVDVVATEPLEEQHRAVRQASQTTSEDVHGRDDLETHGRSAYRCDLHALGSRWWLAPHTG